MYVTVSTHVPVVAFFSGCGLQQIWGRKKGRKKEEKTRRPQMTCMAETSTLRRGYLSSKSLQCTGKSFGIINTTQAPSQVGDDSDVDNELDRMAAAAGMISPMMDLMLEWRLPSICLLLRVGCQNSLEEIDRQRECIQTTSGNTLKTMSIDNYSGIRLTDFATSWNNWIDTLGHSKPTVTHKCQSSSGGL